MVGLLLCLALSQPPSLSLSFEHTKTLVLNNQKPKIYSFALHPKKDLIAYYGENQQLIVYDFLAQKQVAIFDASPRTIYGVSFDGHDCLAIGTTGGIVEKWNYVSDKVEATISTNVVIVRVAYYGSAEKLVVVGWHKTKEKPGNIEIWNLKTKEREFEFETESWVDSLAVSKNGEYFATGETNGKIRLFSTKKQIVQEARFQGHTFSVLGLSFSPKRDCLASGGNDQLMRVWEVMGNKLLSTLKANKYPVGRVAFSPNGDLLVSTDLNKIRCWDPKTWEQIDSFQAHEQLIRQVAFSNDGKLLITASSDGTVKFWKINQNKKD